MTSSSSRPSVPGRIIAATAVYVLFFVCYGLVNRLLPVEACAELATWFDRQIPFVPEFVYAYYLAYVVVLVPAILVSTRRLLRRAVHGFGALVLASCVVFVVFPTQVARPGDLPDARAGDLVAFLFGHDRPSCAFPGLQVSAVFLAMLVLYRERPSYGKVFLPLAVTTTAAALFIGQQSLPGVLGGVALALVVDWGLVSGRAEALIRGVRMAALFRRLNAAATSRPGRAPPPRTRCRTPAGSEFDLYEPSRRPGRWTVVAVAGMTPNGERDPRLEMLCGELSRAGVRTAAVASPGMKALRFDPRDVAVVADVVRHLAASRGEVGMIGFSLGGGIALRAAADISSDVDVGLVVLIGTHYSLPDLWAYLRERFRDPPSEEKAFREFVYVRAILAYQAMNGATSDGEREELIDFLRNDCWNPSDEARRRIYARIEGRPVVELYDERALRELSPAGHLSRLRSRVILLHDAEDRLIPAQHSVRAFEELRRRPAGRGERLLVTPILSHVAPGGPSRAVDLVRLLLWTGELLE